MAEPNAPRDWASRLKSEADRWVADSLITVEQRNLILQRYPRPEATGRDRTILILTLLGSLLVGAGVILFFAANWPRLPATAKLCAVVAAVLAAYGAGWFFRYQPGNSPRLGHSLVFLGSLLYGAGIWLVAQVFHLDSHYPAGFEAWGLGVLPLVAATGSVWVLYLAVLVLTIWSGMEQGGYSYNALYPLIMLAVVAPLSRKVRSALAEAGVALGLLIWFVANVMTHLSPDMRVWEAAMPSRILLIYGAMLFTLGIARLGDRKAYVALGGALSLAGAYILTFRRPAWQGTLLMPSLLSVSPFLTAGLVLFTGVALSAWLVMARRKQPSDLKLAVPGLAFVGASLVAEALPEVPCMIVFNLLLFGGTVGWIVLGIRLRNQMIVNFGLAAFMIHMLTRYFDLFFSAMNRSLFFMLGGLLLLAGGWLLERNRRRWTQGWGGEDIEA